MIVQPLTWKEHDDKKYVVDVYGRTHEGDIARVRLSGFKPYFFIKTLPDLTKIKSDICHSVKNLTVEIFTDSSSKFIVLVTLYPLHRRRIKTEEKAKVVASVWG